MSWDQELEDFKSKIDLREYAASRGYSLDKRESWRSSAVMRTGTRGAGDKVVIKRESDGHYIYFSVRDNCDNGSIIDFIQFRDRITLGQVRKALRPWIGGRTEVVPLFPELVKSSKNRMVVEDEYQRMEDAPAHPYLIEVRKIPAAVLASDRFAGRVRIDKHSNAIFPHCDEQGICGYEKKNKGFTGFPEGGTKGLWISHSLPIDTRLVFAEGAIDALSYAALFPAPEARYASIGGETNPTQPDLVLAEIREMPPGSEIVAAMDNDRIGIKLASVIGEAVIRAGRSDLLFRVHSPALPDQDWNDVLRGGGSFPAALLRGLMHGSVGE